MSSAWAVSPDGSRRIQLGEGAASREPKTVIQVAIDAVQKYPDNPALKLKENGEWKAVTFREYIDLIRKVAKSFIKSGLDVHQSVGIIGFNSLEWVVADLAAIFAGGHAAGIYTTNGAEACHYIADHSEAAVIVCEGRKQMEKFLQIRERLPHLKKIVVYGPDAVPEDPDVMHWNDFINYGADISDDVLAARIAGQKPEHCCTLIYTSGTTGNPKAVMISHDNITWTASTIVDMLSLGPDTQMISYLPLSHIAAQMIDVYGTFFHGGCVWFADPDALKGSLATTLREVRPTVFFGVPRVWEKIQEKLKQIGSRNTGLLKWIADWAKQKGLEGFYAQQRGEALPWFWTLAKLAVFDRVSYGLGFDRCQLFLTGAAPINMDTLEYFASLNVPIMELYGMSECSGPQTVNLPGAAKIGSCGKAIPGVQMIIENPDKDGNGEICFAGRHIMMGYMKNVSSTAETIDSNAYLHSGDVGKIDKDGFLFITGRIKELIITAGGENIPPIVIEDGIKREGPAISNVMVIGDKRKYLTCLITLKTASTDEGASDQLVAEAAQIDPSVQTTQDAMKSEAVRKYIEHAITEYNTKHAVSNAQKVQKFRLLPQDFTVPGGELTPTLKLKRRVVCQKYEAMIEEMYAGAGGD
eukprot:TRINITY_DN1505_c0_g1::TRINITY_DN1505_c0_g1_i1::g.28184::m.28184 TRINITY_DN1505_c0_g1::TRINITY_DN1505_c0_g1_i1::g.28184  ORF type:complete len:655 (+),score=175.46,sp/Q5ZKR7/ACBG2_CHICK/50.46/0.0,AMP-binding/PF00501.23/1.1e-88,Cas_Cas2CT1978/PF09707.5/0.0057,Cas_Cas2CT1978/PF09707.5/6.4e+03 TRINITY_DN1505_c0_g1_i1:51-1967(+)